MGRKILVLTLGGTIDALAYPSEDDAYPITARPSGTNAAFRAIQNLMESGARLEQILICEKDSKNLSADDINTLSQHIGNAHGFDRIVITMGTDKMREVALEIQGKIITPSCPVIFTGAIWPISNGKEITDAYDNLELALKAADLQNKIYIAMSGFCEPPETLIKDFSAKRFVQYSKKIT
jgi:L-asparaginase/Glu-tRNA(Gln) amidotransferase subunit D